MDSKPNKGPQTSMRDPTRAGVYPFAVLLAVCLGCTQNGTSVSVARPAQRALLSAGAVERGQYLRQLSLDLTGRPAAVEDMDAIAKTPELPEGYIDRLLNSAQFLDQVEEWHAEMLWPNLSRYRARPVSLFAAPLPPKPVDAPPAPIAIRPYTTIGWYWGGGDDVSPDPLLLVDEAARARHVVAIFDEGFRSPLRGTTHAYPGGLCDLSPEAEYPNPSVVGTPDNVYTVPASMSGTGAAYTARFYSEDPASLGLVMPIRDFMHCPNYCRRKDCDASRYDHLQNVGPFKGCFTEMKVDGDDPSGRHELDTPGKRCPDDTVREVNVCDFSKVGTVVYNPAFTIDGLPIPARFPGRPEISFVGSSPTQMNRQVEGWRWMEHYWSKGVKLRTCAIESQQREFGLLQKYPDGRPMECSKGLTRGYFIQDASCGCGPKGAYCGPVVPRFQEAESRTQFRFRKSVEAEPLKIIRSVVERNEDYASVLTTSRSFVNGSLAFAWTHQTNVLHGEGFNGISAPDEKNSLWATISFDDDTWTEYQRPNRHAGILTTLEFLQRFPTYRARVAQYRRAFFCSAEFDAAPLPDPSDVNPDIAARKGCSSCHSRLENDGLFFGRYPDRTPTFVDPRTKPNTDTVFQRYFQYRDPKTLARLDSGPLEMVHRDLNRADAFEACTVKRLWTQLVRREPSEAEQTQLARQFAASGRNLKRLVKDIVTSDAYKSVQP